MSEITEIKKDGSKLVVELDEGGEKFTFSFDFVTKVTRNYTQRAVKNFPQKLLQWRYQQSGSYGQHLVIRVWENYMRCGDINSMYKMEKFIPYLHLIHTYYLTNLPDECPPKYAQWCEDNNTQIHACTYKDWLASKIRETWLQPERDMYDKLMEFDFSDYVQKVYMDIQDKPTARLNFTKMMKVSFKTFYLNFLSMCNRSMYYLQDKSEGDDKPRPDNWYEYINPERDIEWNVNNLKSIANKERNDKITAFQTLFKETIEQLSNDKLTIIVPTQMEEFNDESKQQNNCVSYYYHNSMAEHRNMIYFIRRTRNTKHSYITNRYSFSANETVETRAVNNNTYNDKDVTDLIKEIDKKIKNLVQEQRITVRC